MYLDILILSHLLYEPKHGYEIKKRVDETLGGTVQLNDNVLYPALHRFEGMGAVESQLVPQKSSPPRRVYTLTNTGREELRTMLEDFPPELAAREQEFLVRFSHFDFLEPETRLEILGRRIEAVRAFTEHLEQMRTMAAMRDRGYPVTLIEFLKSQMEFELEWLERQTKKEARP